MLQREHSSILLTFIKLPFVIKIFVFVYFGWPFYSGFTVKPCDLFQFVKCKIIKKQTKNLDVELLPSKIKAVLPKMHLSDSVEMCEALWDMYKEGDVLNEVMYLNKTTNAVSFIV